MKLIIDISDKMFDIFKKNGIMTFDSLDEYDKDILADTIANGTPYDERPKGKWVTYLKPSESGFGLTIGIKCPFCEYEVDEKYDFCVCGADMRGDKE